MLREDVLELCQKETSLETTLDAMNLDLTKLPVQTIPDYQRVTRQVHHQQHVDFQARMMSLVRRDKPAIAHPQSKKQACYHPSLRLRVSRLVRLCTAMPVTSVAEAPEDYPCAGENLIVRECEPSMAYNPLYQPPPAQRALVEPEPSSFWTDDTCRETLWC